MASSYQILDERNKLISIDKGGRVLLSTIKLLVIITTMILILFAGTRVNVGADFFAYQDSYNKIRKGLMGVTSIEPIYVLLAKIVSEYRYFLFFIAAFSVVIKVKAISKLSICPFMSMLLYFSQVYIQYDMGIIRQGLAMGIVMLSWSFIDTDELKSDYFIVYFLSVLCYYSAAISIIPVLLRKKRIPISAMMIVTTIAIIFSQVGMDRIILTFLVNFLPKNIKLVSAYSRFSTSAAYINSAFSFTNIRRAILLAFFCYSYTKSEKTQFHSFLLNTYFIGTVIYYLFSSYVVIAGRLGIYFCIADIFLFPISIRTFGKSKMLKLVPVCYALLVLRNTLGIYTESWMNAPYLPYSSWLLHF